MIYTEEAITIWNSFTGFKIFSFGLTCQGQAIQIGCLESVICFSYSLSQYIVASDGKLFYFDLVDNVNVHTEIQGRMLKYPKSGQYFTINVIPVAHLEGDFIFHPWVFNLGFVRAQCTKPNSSRR